MTLISYPKSSSELKVYIFATVMNKLNVFALENASKVVESVDKIYDGLGGDTYLSEVKTPKDYVEDMMPVLTEKILALRDALEIPNDPTTQDLEAMPMADVSQEEEVKETPRKTKK